jgi:hypothetical protein
MATNIVDIPILCPIKFREVGYSNPAPYNTRYMDDWNYPDTVHDFEEKQPYAHPWQQNDIIYIQLLSNYAPHNLYLFDCDGNQVNSFIGVYNATSIEATGQKVYEFAIAVNIYPEGYYKFILESGNPVLKRMEGEWLDLRALHENSIQFKYLHNENDFDVVFETGIEMMFRVYGGLKDFKPASDRTVFIDQTRDIVQLSGKSFYTQKLIIGNAFGVPDWVIERVNQIFQCSQVLIDGRQYVANEGASFEPSREDNYPMAGWALEVRPADHQTRKRFTADGNSNNPTTVVYNIETDAFGQLTGPASTNVIQITSIN